MSTTVDAQGIPTNKPEVTLTDGNVFAVMGACRRAAMKSGWTTAQWAIVRDKFTNSESYDAALDGFWIPRPPVFEDGELDALLANQRAKTT